MYMQVMDSNESTVPLGGPRKEGRNGPEEWNCVASDRFNCCLSTGVLGSVTAL